MAELPQLGPATVKQTGGAYGLGVWTGLPFATADQVQRYVTSKFGAWEQFRKDIGYGPHTGIDLHAAIGTRLFALGAGDVEVAGRSGVFPAAGKYVQIHHGGGLRSYYLHMSGVKVESGDTVSRGEFIGLSGNTSNVAIAPHLHLGINLDSVGSPLEGARVWKDPATMVYEIPVDPDDADDLSDRDIPLRLTPVEAIVVAVDGTVPAWDKQLTVAYKVERMESGMEAHTFLVDRADRERIIELAKGISELEL